MSRHDALALFDEPHIVGILIYIRDNPGCGRTDIYRSVARNDRMSMKIGMLIESGLVTDDASSRRSSLNLTPRGEEVTAALAQIIVILDDD